MIQANVIDVLWVLSERTGRLRYEGIAVVASNPSQRIVVEHSGDVVSDELLSRYRRITSDRRERGLGNG